MLTTLGVIHRIEDLQVFGFAVVFSIMAVQDRRDKTFRYLVLSYLLGTAVSVIDMASSSPMPMALQFTNLALISLRYGAMAFALAEFLRSSKWVSRATLVLAAAPLAAVGFSLHGVPMKALSTLDYSTLAAQFLLLAVVLLSRSELATRTPRVLLAAMFFISVGIRCWQVLAVLHPTHGIVWLRDQLWFLNSTLVGCMMPFTIIWMMNARVHNELRTQSLMDPLTGLMNRRGLELAVAREMARYGRNRQDFAVAIADIDHFKRLNDAHGHSCGDIVLQAFADICKKTLRQTDVIARTGGEEFTFVLPINSDFEMRAVLDRVRVRFEQMTFNSTASATITSTVSIGVTSTAGRLQVTWQHLLGEADMALYQAKRGGRNRTIAAVAAEAPSEPELLESVLPVA